MDLFTFASRSVRNIELGIEHQLWAVSTTRSESAMRGRITKARTYLSPGARGVLYCNPWHAFTTPFIVESLADPDRVVSNVWPEPWRLPFKIKTLGSLSRRLGQAEAAERWPLLKARLTERHGRGGASAAFNFTGTTVFVPVAMESSDWEAICEDLAA